LSSPPPETLDPRSLHRKLLDTVGEMEEARDPVANLAALLRSLVDDPDIPVIGGRIWARKADDYHLVDSYGGRKEIPGDYRIRATEGILDRVRSEGSVFIDPEDPAYNRELESDLGVHEYAAIAFGDDGKFLVAFDVTTTRFEDREEIVGFLRILRHIINRGLEADHYEWIVRETQDIQTSILPREMPDFRDYEIFARFLPVDKEKVGGDLFDFIRIDDESLAVVVADASGHGLPSALMARDIRTAVRMAVIGEIKSTRMMARINRIMCEQVPPGRFVSLFYGEIDRLNQMIYTVAGHPGVHVSRSRVRHLREGGPVLGIHPQAAYTRGICRIRPGDLLCVYTDGISEARSPTGEILGHERIQEILTRFREAPARKIAEEVLDAVDRFTHGAQDDDRTILVLRRNGLSAGDPTHRGDGSDEDGSGRVPSKEPKGPK